MKPTKNKDVVLFCCHEHVLETMSVELHGRSHPAHNAARMVRYPEHRPCGCQGMKVTGSLKGHGLKRLGVKGCFDSPSPGASGLAGSRVNDEVSRF